MIPVRSLTIAALILSVIVAGAAADDCGCGGSDDYWDSDWTGPDGDGWDSDDDTSTTDDNSADTGQDSGDTGNSGVNDEADGGGNNNQDNTGYDTGSDGSSSDSGGSSGAGGGSAEDGILWRMKGDDLFKKGFYNESLSAYEKAISFDPVSFKSWKGKGQVLLALGRTEDAVWAFRQTLKLDPTDAGTYSLLGDAYFATGDYKDAAEQYLKALAMNPKIEGVPEKLSAAYSAENLVQVVDTETPAPPSINATPAEGQAVLIAEDTGTVMIGETSVAVTTTTKAGFPGAVTGILGVLLGLLLIAFRRK